jgi:hypothetical protein
MDFIIKRRVVVSLPGAEGERCEVFWDVVYLFGGNRVSIVLLICLFMWLVY